MLKPHSMTKYLLTFLLLNGLISKAQLFEKTYNSTLTNNTACTHIFDTINGTYLLFSNGAVTTPARIVKINKYGDTLWSKKTKTYTNQLFAPENLIKSANGNVLIFGYALSNISNNSLTKVVIQTYDSNGTYLSADSIPIDLAIGYGLKVTPVDSNNDYYLSYRNDSAYQVPSPISVGYKRRLILEKRNVNNGLIWRKKYEKDCPNPSQCSYDNMFTLKLTSDYHIITNRITTSLGYPLIEEFDGNGNLIRTFNPSLLFNSPVVSSVPTADIIELKDSTLLFICQVNDTFTVKPYFRTLLLKYSRSGTLLDSTSIFNQGIYNVVETSKKEFILNTQPYIPSNPYPVTNTGILHLDKNMQYKNYYPVCFGKTDLYTGPMSANSSGGAFFCTTVNYLTGYFFMASFDSLLNTYPNKINGQIVLDNDMDCSYGSQDYKILGGIVSATDANNQTYISVSNSNGNYHLSIPNGTYTIHHPASINKGNACNTGSIGLVANSNNLIKNYFDTLIPNINDFEINGFLGGRKPGDTTWLKLYYQNRGTTLQNGLIKVVKDTSFTFLYGSPAPVSIQNDTLLFQVSNLKPDSMGSIFIQFTIHPTLALGSNIQTSFAYNLPNDVTPWNNQDTIRLKASNTSPKSVTGNGFRNNSMQVNRPLLIDGNDYLTYRINFQNSGNKTVKQLVIWDTLDSDLDVSTFRVIGSSHPLKEVKIIKNQLHIVYENINLPDSAHQTNQSIGEFLFTVRPKKNLLPNTLIKNNALLFFDMNPKKVTNTTVNKIKAYSIGLTDISSSFQANELVIFPNPSKETINLLIKGNNEPIKFQAITIFNQLGQVVKVVDVDFQNGSGSFPTGQLKDGIYFINLKKVSGQTITSKFIIQK